MSLLQELRVAARNLSGARSFTVAVVLMLALGIGAHLVVYAVVDALVLRPLPFGERSPRLVTLHSTHPTLAEDWDDAGMSYPDLLDFRRGSRTLEGVEGAIDRNLSVATGNDSERVLAASTTPGLLPLIGVRPLLGRTFTAADAAEPGSEQVVILGHGLWRTLCAGDPAAVGKTVLVNGRQLSVVGVMPPGFNFPDQHQMWLPYRGSETTGRANRGLLAVGLLRAAVSREQARAELSELAAHLAQQHPDTNRDWSVHLIPIREYFVSGNQATTLLGAMTALLLVACANAAGLIVARGAGRQRELVLRAALGASRRALVRLLVSETALLAAASGVLGVALAHWGIRALVAWMPEPPPYWAQPSFNARIALFALAVTALVALLAGLAPAWHLARTSSPAALSPGTRATPGTRAQRSLQHTLVVGQIAASLALLVGAVLLSRSAAALMNADVGFDRRALLSARYYLAGDRYDPIEARAAAVDEVVRRVAALPGVRSAAATGSIPSDDGGAAIRLLVPQGGAGGYQEVGAQLIPVTAGFWHTLGLRLVAGRTFTAAETSDPETDAVVVNRRLAARFWPGADAMGRSLRLLVDDAEITARVVGVAPDLVYEEVGEETPQSALNVYVPPIRAGWRTQALLVRTEPNPASLAAAVRAAVRAALPGSAVYDVMTMDARRAFNHQGDRTLGATFSAFALGALLLAWIGVYAIVAHGVQQRRREIGVRVALGAAGESVLRLFLAQGVRLALLGAAVGLPLALATARLLEAELFQVSPWEPRLWLALPALILLAVVAASYLPARRATQIDPAAMLREG